MIRRLSVIIPTHNRATLLPQAIESVLRQTFAPHEILVVDDGSTDDTRAVIQAYGEPVRYLYQAKQGPAAARNLAVANARGDVLTFLDDDDIWLPRTLESGVERLQDSTTPRVDMCFGLTMRAENITWNGTDYNYEPIPPRWAIMSFCTLFCPRAVFERVGPLDETLYYGEDVDWFMRVRELDIPFAFLAQVTHLYRRHQANMTSDKARSDRHFLKALKLSLTRRAAADGGKARSLPDVTQGPPPETGEETVSKQ